MRVHVVAPSTSVFSFFAFFTPRIESERVVVLNAVAVNPSAKPHVVEHEVGVRVRTLSLIRDDDVLKGQSVPITSNLRQVVDVAVKIVSMFPIFVKSDHP